MKNESIDFINAIEIVEKCLKDTKSNSSFDKNAYDGIAVKSLCKSNTLDHGEGNETHIAITGEQMCFFPYVCQDVPNHGNKKDTSTLEILKKYYTVAIEVIFNQENFEYLHIDHSNSNYIFINKELKSHTCIWIGKRTNQPDQIKMSLITCDHPSFVDFRKSLKQDDYLLILKRKNKLIYEFYGIKNEDLNEIKKLNNRCIYSNSITLIPVSNISISTAKPNVPYNYILFGAPGNGKSYQVKQIVEGYIHFRTTFHSELDYNGFVGVYKPITNSKSIEYKFTPKIFLKAYVKAWEQHKTRTPVFLDIEEINRGNCALIFGDIFQLLDRDENGYSAYPIDVDDDIRTYLKEYFENLNDDVKNDYINSISNLSKVDKFDYGKIAFPNNFFIISTMNTSDQSLFPVDSAFRRRFSWKYVPINYDEIKDYTLECDGSKYSYKDILEKLNNKIKLVTDSEDKQIGQRFIKLDNNSKIITAEDFINKICLSVWNDVFKDEGESENNFFCIKENEKLSSISFNELAIKNSLLNEIFKFNDIGLSTSKSNVTVETKSETQISDQNSSNDDEVPE